jgi:hypothetical protein
MKKTFNEIHQWVAQKWTEARQLEESMNEVRERYETVCERVVQVVQAETPELDNCRTHPKQGGDISFSRKKWLTQYESWPAGLWIGNINLDILMADEPPDPYASIWLGVPKDIKFDLERARSKLQNAAPELLKGEKLKWFFSAESEREKKTCFWYELPESRSALVKMLLESKSEEFIECIASHVMILGRFIPVLDEILLKNSP